MSDIFLSIENKKTRAGTRRSVHNRYKLKEVRAPSNLYRIYLFQTWITRYEKSHGEGYAYRILSFMMNVLLTNAVNIEFICIDHWSLRNNSWWGLFISNLYVLNIECYDQCSEDKDCLYRIYLYWTLIITGKIKMRAF